MKRWGKRRTEETTQNGRHHTSATVSQTEHPPCKYMSNPSVCVLRESRQNRTNFSMRERVKGVCVLETAKEATEQNIEEGKEAVTRRQTEQEEGIVHVCGVCVCMCVTRRQTEQNRTNVNERRG